PRRELRLEATGLGAEDEVAALDAAPPGRLDLFAQRPRLRRQADEGDALRRVHGGAPPAGPRRRRIPRPLRSELDSTICTPRARPRTAGTTRRSDSRGSSSPKERSPQSPSAQRVAASPATTRSAPAASPVSSFTTRKSAFRRGSSGRSPSFTA